MRISRMVRRATSISRSGGGPAVRSRTISSRLRDGGGTSVGLSSASVSLRGMSAPTQRDDGAFGRVDDALDLCCQPLNGVAHSVEGEMPVISFDEIAATVT